MVGWLKHFVQTKALPGESLIKGYTIHMLARRAPTCLVQDFEARSPTYGTAKARRGKLKLLSTLLAEKQGKPGCGLVIVTTSRRNNKEYLYAQLPPILQRYFKACNDARRSDRFRDNVARVKFMLILKGKLDLK
jgi:hypothetical protein